MNTAGCRWTARDLRLSQQSTRCSSDIWEGSGLMGVASMLIAKAAPSGGAAIGQTIGATAGALVITAAMLTIVARHRSGRLPQVGRLAAFAERSSGIPGWPSLPIAIVVVALLVAVFGMYWDISIHLD